MAQEESNQKTSPRSGLTIGIAIAIGLLLLIANIAFWFNRYIFDQNNFTRTATAAIQQESSRQAVADDLTDRLLANRPLLARVAEEPASKIIAGALGSNIANKVFARAIDGLHTMATSPNPQDITLDLTTFKQIAAGLAGTFGAQQGEAPVNVADLPDTITIVSADKVPNIYTAGVVLLWVGPFAAIAAIALAAYLIYRARSTWRNIASTLATFAVALAAFGILALLIGPLFQPLLLANVQGSNQQTVVSNIYNAFMATFDKQSSWLFFGLAVLSFLIAIAIWLARPFNNWLQQKRRQA